MTRVDELTRRRRASRKGRAARARADVLRGERPTRRQLDYLRAIATRAAPVLYIAGQLDVGEHAAGEMIRRLERAGWVAEVASRRPRRRKIVQLTGPGVMACLLAGARAFADEMREQGIHVGMGDPAACVICLVPWPCAAASPAPEPPCLADADDHRDRGLESSR